MDPRTGRPHIYEHNVQENEVEDVLGKPVEDRVGSEGSRIAVGQTELVGTYASFMFQIHNRIQRS